MNLVNKNLGWLEAISHSSLLWYAIKLISTATVLKISPPGQQILFSVLIKSISWNWSKNHGCNESQVWPQSTSLTYIGRIPNAFPHTYPTSFVVNWEHLETNYGTVEKRPLCHQCLPVCRSASTHLAKMGLSNLPQSFSGHRVKEIHSLQ